MSAPKQPDFSNIPEHVNMFVSNLGGNTGALTQLTAMMKRPKLLIQVIESDWTEQ